MPYDTSFSPSYDADGWKTIPNPSDGPTKQKAESGWKTISNPSDEPSTLSKGIDYWDSLWFNKPISKTLGVDLPAWGKSVSDYVTDPNSNLLDPLLKYSPAGMFGVRPEVQRGLIGGLTEGTSQVAEGLTSPLNIATAGFGMRAQGLLRTADALDKAGDTVGALRKFNTAQKLITADKALGAAQIPTGGIHAYKGYEEGDPTQMLMGAAEMAGGAAAAFQTRPSMGAKTHREPTQEPLPLTSDWNPPPSGLLNGDTPGRSILQDNARAIENRDRAIQGIVRGNDRPTFDVDPFADVTNALKGADIATRASDGAVLESIPLETNIQTLKDIHAKYLKILSEGMTKGTDAEVDMAHKIYNATLERLNAIDRDYSKPGPVGLEGQQTLPGFDLADLPPRGVPPEGPFPDTRPLDSTEQYPLPLSHDIDGLKKFGPGAMVEGEHPKGEFSEADIQRMLDEADELDALANEPKQGKLMLHDEDWWSKRDKREARRDPTRQVEGLNPAQLDTNFDPEYAAAVLRDVPPGPPGLSVSGEGGVITITYRGPDGAAIADAMVYKGGVLSADAPASVASFAADKSKGMLYGRAVKALGDEIIKLGALGPSGKYSLDTQNLVQRAGEGGYLPPGGKSESLGGGPDQFYPTEPGVDTGMGGDLLREPTPPSTFGPEQGGDMAFSDWSKRPHRLDPRGDEAIPEMAFQPDEGKATEAEFKEGFLPEEGGLTSNDITRQTIEEETRIGPEHQIKTIITNNPELADEALDIYRETDPQRISENLAYYIRENEKAWTQVFRAEDSKNRGGPPVPQELRDAHRRTASLKTLAQAKYERASSRIIRGKSEPPGGRSFQSPEDFHQGELPIDTGMGGMDPLRESTPPDTFGMERGGEQATGGDTGAPPPDPERIRAALRQSLGREPTQAEIDDAVLQEQIGVNPSVVPKNPVDVAIGNVLHAFGGNPDLKWTEVLDMLSHLSPADARKAQTIIIQMVNKGRYGLEIPDPLESRPLDPAWEETPAEALEEDIPTTSIGGIIDEKKQALRDMSYDPSGMSGWEADMALQRVNRAREVPPGEQPLLGLEEQKPSNVAPESEQVRQKDVLKVATLMEAGMVKEAQEIRQLHDMYGQPITNAEEVAALAEHYTRMGDAEKAAKYNELADRYSGIEQGQQDMFKPNQMEGGAPDDPNGRIPPEGPLGVRPSGVLRNPPLKDSVLPPRQAEAVARQQRVDDVIRIENQARAFEKQAKAAMDTNNPELALQHAGTSEKLRSEAAAANMKFAKEMKGKIKEAERFESMARAREAAGDTEGAARLKAQAETEYLREAGQLELRFRKNFLAQKMEEMGFTLSEKTIHDIDNLDPQYLAHNLQKDFADLVLAIPGKGKPGLTVTTVKNPNRFVNETSITIRNEQGKPIAYAEMESHPITGANGNLVNWAIDQKAGMGQQAILPLAMELEKRGGLVPKGPYSADTKNFLQRLVAALKGEKGSTPIFTGGGGPTKKGRPAHAGGTWWDLLKDRAGWGQGYKTTKRQRLLAKQQVQWIDEALAMPANMTTTGDLSAPGRQGLMLFHTPEFWNAFIAMFKGIRPEAFDRIDAELKNMRIMQSQGTDPKTGKPLPSMAQQWGMKMFAPASQPGPHARGAASNWLETGRFFNKDIPYITKGWAKSPMAMIIRGSNRAFITFLNHLNVNRLQYLAERAQDNAGKAHQGKVRKQGLLGGVNPSEFRFGIGKFMPDVNLGLSDSIDFSTASKAETKAWHNYADSLDPYNNIALGKELADAVNTLTGHAPLKTHILPFRGAELNLEKHARLLGRIFFAPGLLASRVRMMWPPNYIMASPTVRKQMVGGLFGATAGYTAAALLLKNGAEAMGYETDINLDSNSADFGKIRIGNYRMDPSGGILPYIVLYSRLLTGYYTSSATGKTTELGQGFHGTTADTLTDRFFTNKQEPIFKFATDMMMASEHQPVYMKDRMLQMMAPMLGQDIWEVSKEDPGLIPLSIGSFFGAGSQVYKQGVAGTRFTDPKNEWIYAGGGARGLIYGADFQNQPQRQMGPRKASPRQFGPRQSAPRQATPRE